MTVGAICLHTLRAAELANLTILPTASQLSTLSYQRNFLKNWAFGTFCLLVRAVFPLSPFLSDRMQMTKVISRLTSPPPSGATPHGKMGMERVSCKVSSAIKAATSSPIRIRTTGNQVCHGWPESIAHKQAPGKRPGLNRRSQRLTVQATAIAKDMIDLCRTGRGCENVQVSS